MQGQVAGDVEVGVADWDSFTERESEVACAMGQLVVETLTAL